MFETLAFAQTKFYPPHLRSDLLPRLRLVAALDQAVKVHPFTLLSAPAGYGKTTLLAQWIADCDWQIAWLSLDEGDNDLTRFLAALFYALQTVGLSSTAGQANGDYPHYLGGGMYNRDGSPMLRNLIFSGNLANYATDDIGLGGGMYNDNGSPSLTNVVFTGNSSAWLGGGMCNDESSHPTLTDVTFRTNSARDGGGMANDDESHPTLNNVVFTDNAASAYGGGMFNDWRSSPTLTDVIFSDNEAYDGGGMYNDDASHPTLTNVTFSGNTAEAEGGGMSNYDGSNPVLTNVIMWGDTAYTDPEIANYTGSTPVVTYSDIQGGYTGTGNINADPRFVHAASGNLRLQPGSPCIDAGNNAAVPAGVTTDLDGNPRIVDGNGDGNAVVDMGAYEAPQSRKIYLPLVLRNR